MSKKMLIKIWKSTRQGNVGKSLDDFTSDDKPFCEEMADIFRLFPWEIARG